MVFWLTQNGREIWLTPDNFASQQEKARQRYLKNAESIKAKMRQKYRENPEVFIQKAKEYAEKNAEKVKAKARKRAEESREERKSYLKAWYRLNRDKVAAKQKEYAKKNPHIILKCQQRFYAKYPLKAFQKRIRTLIGMSLSAKEMRKKSKSESILGCSLENCVEWIKSQFAHGMSWDNRHLWHIDHVIPMACAKDETESLMLNHYTNLRPLWISDNLKKSDTLPENFVDLWNSLCKKTGNELKMR